MKRQYSLVVFDWEGTLAEDTYGQIVNVLRQEAEKLQIASFDIDTARRYAGCGLLTMVSRLYPDMPIHHQEQLIKVTQDALNSSNSQVHLIANVEDTLRALSKAQVKLAVATNRSLTSLQRVISNSGIEHYFATYRTASQAPAKPCPDMLAQIMVECGVDESETLMIGDSISDVEMAVMLGVDAIGVDFYHEQQGDLLKAGAVLEIDNYKDLLSYLKL